MSEFPVRPLWPYVRVQQGYPFESEDFNSAGELPLVRIRDLLNEEFATYIDEEVVPSTNYLVDDGDLLIGMDGDFNSITWHRGQAALNQRVCKVMSSSTIDSRFLAYAIRRPLTKINELRYATTVKHLSQDDIYGLRIPMPSVETQRRIADYLDKETDEIDAMVHALDEYKSLLGARFASARERLVSDLKTEPVPVGTLGTVTLGKMISTNSRLDGEVSQPYLRAAHVQPMGELDFNVVEKTMWFTQEELFRLNLVVDDVVVVEGGAGFGRSALIREDLEGWGFQNSIIRFRPDHGIANGAYVCHMLRRALERGEIEIETSTATLPHFTAEKLGRFRIPYVPFSEQKRIGSELDQSAAIMRQQLSHLDSLRSLLIKRRQVLINDVVTGKKQV